MLDRWTRRSMLSNIVNHWAISCLPMTTVGYSNLPKQSYNVERIPLTKPLDARDPEDDPADEVDFSDLDLDDLEDEDEDDPEDYCAICDAVLNAKDECSDPECESNA